MQDLDEEKLGYLRIEKVGEYYAVRLGRFQDYVSAREFLQDIRPKFPRAFVLKAYIIDERTIVRLYRDGI